MIKYFKEQVIENIYKTLREKGFEHPEYEDFMNYNNNDEYICDVIEAYLDKVPQITNYSVDSEEVDDNPAYSVGYVSLAYQFESAGSLALGHESFVWRK